MMKVWHQRKSRRPRFVIDVDNINGQRGINSGTYILDITPDGAQIETDIHFQAGDSVNFDISLDLSMHSNQLDSLNFNGTIVWSQQITTRYRYGIKFSEHSGINMTKIFDYFRPDYF
jgi:hypothetical protein